MSVINLHNDVHHYFTSVIWIYKYPRKIIEKLSTIIFFTFLATVVGKENTLMTNTSKIPSTFCKCIRFVYSLCPNMGIKPVNTKGYNVSTYPCISKNKYHLRFYGRLLHEPIIYLLDSCMRKHFENISNLCSVTIR